MTRLSCAIVTYIQRHHRRQHRSRIINKMTYHGLKKKQRVGGSYYVYGDHQLNRRRIHSRPAERAPLQPSTAGIRTRVRRMQGEDGAAELAHPTP